MQSPIFSVAKLVLKQCFKTWFVWILLVLSILCIVGASGRGSSPEMIRQISFCWLPTGILTVFVIGVLWMGCSSIANDIEENRFIGTAVAPVKKISIWVGRWLGLMLAISLLLAFVFLLVGLNGVLSVGSSRPREQLELVPEIKEQTVHEIYQYLLEQKFNDSNGVFVQTKEEKDNSILELSSLLDEQYLPLPAGASRTWDFSLKGFDLKDGETISLEVAFVSTIGSTGGANGVLKIYGISNGNDENSKPICEYEMSNETHGKTLFNLPVNDLSGADVMRVVFENAQADAGGSTVYIKYSESLCCFAPNGFFWGNLFYAYLMCLGVLSIVAAIGISFGMQYSFPVAMFCSFVLMLICILTSCDSFNTDIDMGGHYHGKQEEIGLGTKIIRTTANGISKGVHYMTSSYMEEMPLEKLGGNFRINGDSVLSWMLVSFVIIPSILCSIGSIVLSRKEFK